MSCCDDCMLVDKMVRVLLYENGEVEIEPEDRNLRTCNMFFGNEKGHGEEYICEKGMESFYLKKLLSKRKKEIAEKIKELKIIEARVNRKLSELK